MQTRLTSSDGEWELALTLLHSETYASEPGLQSSLYARGQHWDGDHYFPLEVSIQGLCLRAPQLLRLRDRLTDWLGLPLADLDPAKLDGVHILSGLPGQLLSVRFGKRDRDEIPSSLKPVVTVNFAAGAVSGEFYFETDQSCLGAFRSGLGDLVGPTVQPGIAPDGQSPSAPARR
jgi:hypothetical protein